MYPHTEKVQGSHSKRQREGDNSVIGNKEQQKEDNKLNDVGLVLDMVMMALTNKGKERTLDEWAYVLREAGFSRHTVRSIAAIQSVIEAFPA